MSDKGECPVCGPLGELDDSWGGHMIEFHADAAISVIENNSMEMAELLLNDE